MRSPGIFIPPCLSPDSEQLMRRAELAAAREVAVEPGSPEATGSEDCSSDASFVTASEDSLQPQRPAGTLGSTASLWPSGGAEAAGDGVLSRQLQALTLTTGVTNVPSLPGDRDSGALHPHGSVPPMSDLQLLQALRALGHSPGPVTPFTRGHYLRRLQEAQASPGESLGRTGSPVAVWNPETCLLGPPSSPAVLLSSGSVFPSQLFQGTAQNWRKC